MKKVNSKKGFTLAELLVVVAILAILVAIAIPVFGGALDSAKKTADDANIRSAYAQYTITKMADDDFAGAVSQATTTEAEQAFADIDVGELQYYSGVTIPKNGGAWKGTGTGGASSISATRES